MRVEYTAWANLVILAGCAGGGGASGEGAAGPPPVPVEVVVAAVDTVVDAIAATGQIEAVQSIVVRAEATGKVMEIPAREGGAVAQGAPLVRVDDAELRAEVARAEADRDLARQALERTRELLARDAASRADLERAEATARSTQAALDLLQVRLVRTTVHAPFAGIVGARQVSLGDYVTPAVPLMTLETVDPQRAVFAVAERYAEALRLGQTVSFQVAALPGRQFQGTVDFISPAVDSTSRAIVVKARVRNPRRDLQAGMFLDLRLASAVRPRAVVVPEEALVPLEGAVYVWVIQDGAAVRREAVIGVRTPGFVEIRSGVAPGEHVVVTGQVRLQPGAKVTETIVTRDAAATHAAERAAPSR